MEPPNILQQTQSDIHSHTVISIPFRNAIFTLPGAAQMIMGDTKLIASVTICGVIDSYSWQGQTVHCH